MAKWKFSNLGFRVCLGFRYSDFKSMERIWNYYSKRKRIFCKKEGNVGRTLNPFQEDHDRGFVLWQSFLTRVSEREPRDDPVGLSPPSHLREHEKC